MGISPSPSKFLDLDKNFGSTALSYYPPTHENCRTSMYAMPEIKSYREAKIQDTCAMQSNMLCNNDSTIRTSVATPKKGNFLTSMFGAFTSILAERLSKVPSSFMSNINNSLSVTVVPNEGIISQDFFKNLTRSSENNEKLPNVKNNDVTENSRKTDILAGNIFYNVESPLSHIITDKTTKYPFSSKVALNIDCNKTHDQSENSNDTRFSDCPIISTDIFNELNVKIVAEISHDNRDSIFNEIAPMIINDDVESNEEDSSTNLGVTVINDSFKVKMIHDLNSSSRSAVPKIMEKQEKMDISNETCTFGWQTMFYKVMNGMSERFSSTTRDVSPDNEEVVPMKKPNLSKTTRRKISTIARNRGKGRGKSQLRRNGVSQSSHRKERTKHYIYSNIQDDLDALEDSECCDDSDDDDSSAINERQFEQQCSPSYHCLTLLESLSFDVSSGTRKRKQGGRMPDTSSKCPTRVNYVPESTMEVENNDTSCIIENDFSSKFGHLVERSLSESSDDSDDSYCIVFKNDSELENHDSTYIIEKDIPMGLNKFRQRSISQCTNDSEDSCSIVFENGSELENSDYDDVDGDTDGTSDEVSDDDSDDFEKSTQTVRFNLKPEVHKMIKWDYAYRAARRGPWEEMARDRERFRCRIHRTEKILNPMLSMEHRNLIWQKRFDPHDVSGQRVQTFLTKTLT